jgi:hypothetical protein
MLVQKCCYFIFYFRERRIMQQGTRLAECVDAISDTFSCTADRGGDHAVLVGGRFAQVAWLL